MPLKRYGLKLVCPSNCLVAVVGLVAGCRVRVEIATKEQAVSDDLWKRIPAGKKQLPAGTRKRRASSLATLFLRQDLYRRQDAASSAEALHFEHQYHRFSRAQQTAGPRDRRLQHERLAQ